MGRPIGSLNRQKPFTDALRMEICAGNDPTHRQSRGGTAKIRRVGFWEGRICGGRCRNKHASLGNFSPSGGVEPKILEAFVLRRGGQTGGCVPAIRTNHQGRSRREAKAVEQARDRHRLPLAAARGLNTTLVEPGSNPPGR